MSTNPPQEQARWQETEGVWLNEGRQLAQAVFVLDRADRIAYAEYVAEPLREPDYAAALQAVLQAALA